MRPHTQFMHVNEAQDLVPGHVIRRALADGRLRAIRVKDSRGRPGVGLWFQRSHVKALSSRPGANLVTSGRLNPNVTAALSERDALNELAWTLCEVGGHSYGEVGKIVFGVSQHRVVQRSYMHWKVIWQLAKEGDVAARACSDILRRIKRKTPASASALFAATHPPLAPGPCMFVNYHALSVPLDEALAQLQVDC